MRLFLLTLLCALVLFQRPLLAQVPPCATMEVDQQLRQQFPELGTHDDFERWLQPLLQHAEQRIDAQGKVTNVITIPVVFHVIYSTTQQNISDNAILSQITVLNEDFRRLNPDTTNAPIAFRNVAADIGIEFCLARQDPSGNPHSGITRTQRTGAPFTTNFINSTLKPQTGWDPNRYFNIWVCDIEGQIAGYAQFPSTSGLQGMPANGGAANTDGIVLDFITVGRPPHNSFGFRGRTATHEVGHWLGLRHIWGDGGCTVDDFCADTPSSDSPNYQCPTNAIKCGSQDMVQNYMDYTNDNCMSIFTRNQRTRMLAVMQNSPRRGSLLTSNVCVAPSQAPVADFRASDTVICQGSSVTFQDLSANGPTAWSWTFTGGTPSSSTAQNPTVTYNTAGTYAVTLTASNGNGSNTRTRTGYIQVVGPGVALPFSETFESNSFATNGWQVVNPDNATTWAIRQISGTTPGNRAAWMDFYNYNAAGQQDLLGSPMFDLQGYASISLTFQWAYTRYTNGTTASPSDTIRLFGVSNCGSTTVLLWEGFENGSRNFATRTDLNAAFVPASANEWCGGAGNPACASINLTQFSGQRNFMLIWQSTNNYGNNFFLDNINVTGTTGTAPPQAEFAANVTSVCPGRQVSYTNLTTGGATSFSWSFPGGTPNTSTATNPTVTYNTPGTYAVTLTATNSAGSDVETKTGYITVEGGRALPFTETFESNSFATNGWTIENPDNARTWALRQIGGTTPGNRAAWMDFFNYTTLGQRDALITPPLDLTGNTTVSMSFEHAYRRYNTTSSDSLILSVSTDCGVTWQQIAALGENGSGTFATTSTSTTAFVPAAAADWCLAGTIGASCLSYDLSPYIGPSVRIKFESVNRYGNNLYLDNINITGSFTALVANFAASETTICPGAAINFEDLSTGNPTQWNWTFTGGSPSSSTLQNPFTIVYPTAGTYPVKLVVRNANGADSLTRTSYITVRNPPVITLAGTDPSCGAQNGTINTTVTGTGPFTYSWLHGPTSANLTGLAAGTYYLSVSDGVCSTSDSIRLQGNATQPNVIATVTNLTCLGSADGRVEVGLQGGQGPFQFALEAGAFQAGNVFTGLVAGTYTVKVRDGFGCEFTRSVQITQPTSVQASATTSATSQPGANDGSISATATGGNGGPFSYSLDGVSYQADGNFTGLAAGTYTVRVKDSRGCDAQVQAVVQAGTSSTSDALRDALRVYPNPTADVMWVDLGALNHGSVELTLADANGKRAWQQTAVAVMGTPIQLNLAGVAAGHYTLTVSLGESRASLAVIKR